MRISEMLVGQKGCIVKVKGHGSARKRAVDAGFYKGICIEVLDKDAYQAFVETGNLFDKATAARFRKLLESGGMKDGMTLYREFRGAEPSRDALMVARGFVTAEEVAAEQQK